MTYGVNNNNTALLSSLGLLGGNTSNLSSLSSLLGASNNYSSTTDGLSGLGSVGTDFGSLISSGLTGDPYNTTGSYAGASLSPTSAALLTEGANALSQNLLGRLGGSDKYGYPNTSPYGSSPLFGLSSWDLLSTIATNTLPYVKSKGSWGFLFQSLPQVMQLVTGVVGGVQAFKEYRQTAAYEKAQGNHMQATLAKELQDDIELSEEF